MGEEYLLRISPSRSLSLSLALSRSRCGSDWLAHIFFLPSFRSFVLSFFPSFRSFVLSFFLFVICLAKDASRSFATGVFKHEPGVMPHRLDDLSDEQVWEIERLHTCMHAFASIVLFLCTCGSMFH